MYTLLLGGARSGKSTGAQRLATAAGASVVFIATATAGDEEMAARIAQHRRSRPVEWETVEEPLDLTAAVQRAGPASFIVVDCLTLWVSNLMGSDATDDGIVAVASHLSSALADRPGPGAVVSNEVGWGIVPDNALSRRYRDLLGVVNTVFAERADRSLLMVAGRSLTLKAPEDV